MDGFYLIFRGYTVSGVIRAAGMPAKPVNPEFQANSVDFHMQTLRTLVMCPMKLPFKSLSHIAMILHLHFLYCLANNFLAKIGLFYRRLIVTSETTKKISKSSIVF